MSIPAIAAIVAFAILFGLWVILPNHIAKRHQSKAVETEKQSSLDS
jgi:hypothetical protein